jgi:hypothetical protein
MSGNRSQALRAPVLSMIKARSPDRISVSAMSPVVGDGFC